MLAKLRDSEVLRYFIHSSHYRGPINYSPPQLEQADAALTRIYTALRDLPRIPSEPGAYSARFSEVMNDDLNTPEAFAVLQGMAREINTARAAHDLARAAAIGAELVELGSVLGVAQRDPTVWFQKRAGNVGESVAGASTNEQIEALIARRLEARRSRNWAESDRIRKELAAQGIALEDKPGGETLWRRG